MLNVILLGLVSFFSDISTEMVYPLIPLYLTSTFGVTPALIGVIEGIAESMASLLKVFSGYVTDKYNNKKTIAGIGYATGIIYKIALIIASSWAGVLIARIIDRVGKGIRTAPRDVLVSESADKNSMGKAFGIHKALDMAGSAVGILLAFLIVSGFFGTFSYKRLFVMSIIPAVIGIIIMIFVKEKKEHKEIKKREPFWQEMKNLNGNLKLYLLVAFIFTLGNSSNAFLLLKAKSVGFTDTNVVLLYLLYNLVAAVAAIPFGKISDKIGRKKVLVAGYITYAVVYFGFAMVNSSAVMITVFALYGFYTALIAGAERAFIAEISPTHLKGTMLGMHSTVVGIALLPASVIAGALWNAFGDKAPFIFGASLSLAAAIILLLLFQTKVNNGEIAQA